MMTKMFPAGGSRRTAFSRLFLSMTGPCEHARIFFLSRQPLVNGLVRMRQSFLIKPAREKRQVIKARFSAAANDPRRLPAPDLDGNSHI
jgi:hypothetical protein